MPCRPDNSPVPVNFITIDSYSSMLRALWTAGIIFCGNLVLAQPLREVPVRLEVQTGSPANVLALAYAPSGKFLITASAREAIVWRVNGARQLAVLSGHTNLVTGVGFLPGTERAVTASLDKTVRIWDVASQKEIRQFVNPANVGALAISPRGDFIAAAVNKVVQLWDVNSGVNIRTLEGHTAFVGAVAFSPDGKFLASASFDQTARLWDVSTGQEIRRFDGHGSPVNTVAFSPDGTTLATGSGSVLAVVGTSKKELEQALQSDHSVRLWTAATGQEILRIDAPSAVRSVAFRPGGRNIAIAGGIFTNPSCTGCEWRLLDVSTGRNLAKFPGGKTRVGLPLDRLDLSNKPRGVLATFKPQEGISSGRTRGIAGGLDYAIEAIAFSPDGNSLAITHFDTVAVASFNRTQPVNFQSQRPIPGSDATVSSNSRFLYTGAQAWDLAAGRPVKLPGQMALTHGDFSTDSTTLVVPSLQDVRFFDLNTRAESRRFAQKGFNGMFYSPDGKLLLARKPGEPLCLLDAISGEQVRCLDIAAAKMYDPEQIAFSPSGEAIVTSGMTAFHIWDTATGHELRSIPQATGMVPGRPEITPEKPPSMAFPIAFVSDDVFAGVSGPNVHFYNWRSGQQLRVIKTGPATAMSVSSDGRWLALGPWGAANFVRVWDLNSEKEVWSAPYDESVETLRFTRDSRILIVPSATGTTYLHDPASGKLLCSFVAFFDGSWAVTDPDGRYDASDPDNAKGIHWVAGDEVIELGQLKQRFYTPGLLARVLQGERLPEVASIQTVKLFPAIMVHPLAPGDKRLELTLTNRGGGIGRVVIKVNGREISTEGRGASADPKVDPKAATARLSIDLRGAPLAFDGKNTIEIVAYDAAGMLCNRGVVVSWTTPAAKVEKPRLFALIAGVSEYDNPALNLKYPAKDAADFGHAVQLGANRLLGTEKVSIELLSTAQVAGALPPTKEQFRKSIDRIVRDAASQDIFVLYLAGHGVARRGVADQYYFLTPFARSTELPSNDPEMLDKAAVSSEELKEWCKRIRALKQVIILDTCAAGAANQELLKLAERRELSPDQIRALEFLKDSTGSHVLMGSAADAVSYEAGRYGQGLLTYALLEGIKGAALEDGQFVNVVRLFDFAAHQVEQLASGIGGIQRPLISSPQGRSFAIGQMKEEDKQAIHLAAPKPQVLRPSCLDDNDADPQSLTARVRAFLRDAAAPVTRGQPGSEPPLIYLDAVVNDLPSAFTPRIRYAAQPGSLKVRVRLFRENQPAFDQSLSVSSDPDRAAREIGEAIIKAAATVSAR